MVLGFTIIVWMEPSNVIFNTIKWILQITHLRGLRLHSGQRNVGFATSWASTTATAATCTMSFTSLPVAGDLFSPQCLHRFHARRMPGRYPRRRQSRSEQHTHRRSERPWVFRSDSEQHRFEQSRYKPRSGRPQKLGERESRILTRILANSDQKTAESVRKQASVHHNIVVSKDTVRRCLNKSGYVARVKRKKPILTNRHKKARLNWAKEKRSWTVEQWQNVVWSDETALTLVQEGREYTWLKKGEDILDDKFVQGTKKFGGGKKMIWHA